MTQLSSMMPSGAPGPFGAPAAPAPTYAGPFGGGAPPPAVAPMAGPFQPAPTPNPDAWREKLKLLMPAIASGLGPAFGMNGTAALLGGIMRGQEHKRAAGEQIEQTQQRRAMEGAKFRMDALSEVAKLPPEQQGVFVEALTSIGRELYGVDLQSELGQMQQAGAPAAAAAASKKQQAEAAEVVKRNDALAKGRRWSAPDPETGESRPETWWRQRAAQSATLTEGGEPLLPEAEKDDPADLTKSGLDVQLAEAMKREAAGDPNAAADVARLKKAIAEADALRRDPRAPRQAGPTDAQSFGMSERLAKAWTTANAPVKEMDRQLRIMNTGLKRFRSGDTNGGSQAVLVTFQKILDPTSVVRESEYARTTDGQALLDRLEGYVTRIQKGGTTLTDRELQAMVQTAQQMFDGMSQWSAGTRRRIQAQADKYGLGPETIFDDALIGGDDLVQRGAPEKPSALPNAQPNKAPWDYAEYLRTRGGDK